MADTAKSRTVGLLGHKGLHPDQALIIRPCWSIHTLFMRFAIDVLFLDKSGLVRKIVHRMPAWRFAAAWGSRDTIELAAGALERVDVREGDVIQMLPSAD